MLVLDMTCNDNSTNVIETDFFVYISKGKYKILSTLLHVILTNFVILTQLFLLCAYLAAAEDAKLMCWSLTNHSYQAAWCKADTFSTTIVSS